MRTVVAASRGRKRWATALAVAVITAALWISPPLARADDTVAPIVSVTQPLLITPNTGIGTTNVRFTANEAGTYRIVSGTNCSGTELKAATSYPTANVITNVSINNADLDEGANTIRVCVTDAGGNTGSGAAPGILIKNTNAPSVTVTQPAADATVGVTGDTTVSFSADEAGTYRIMSGTCASGTELKAATSYPTASATETTTIANADLNAGVNTIRVCVTDSTAATGSRAAAGSITKDATAPAVTVTQPSADATVGVSGTTSVSFSATESGTYRIVSGADCSGTELKAATSYPTANATLDTTIVNTDLNAGANTIRVCVTDGVANTASGAAAGIITKDVTEPIVTVTQPAADANNDGSGSTTVSFSATEAGTYRIVSGTCASGAELKAATSYPTVNATVTTTIANADLDAGPNTIRVCVTDAVANTGSGVAAGTITKDTSAPIVTVTQPAADATNDGSGNTTISFSATEAGTYRIVSGTCASGTELKAVTSYPTASATVTTTIPNSNLDVGANTIRVCVTDVALLTGSGVAAGTITKDTSAPGVTLTLPSTDASVGGGGTTTVSFSATEAGTYRIVSGTCASGTELKTQTNYPTANATVTTTIANSDLDAGANTIRVCVTDVVANTGSGVAPGIITKDTSAPAVTVTLPSTNVTNSGTGTTNVRFSATESGTYRIVSGATCAGTELKTTTSYPTANATATTTINNTDLDVGANTIRVCVTDAVANTGSGVAPGIVTKDTGAPGVTVTQPSADAVVGVVGTTSVSFSATESGTYRIVSGADCSGTELKAATSYPTANATVTTTITNSDLNVGANTIRVCVSDSVANTGSSAAAGIITQDASGPGVTVTQPSVSVTNAGTSTTTVSFSATEVGTYRIVSGADCSGTELKAATSYPTANATVTTTIANSDLNVGANTIRVCVADAVANTGSAVAAGTITKDTSAPEVTVTQPVADATNDGSGSTTVSFSATESGTYRIVSGTCASGNELKAQTNYPTANGVATTSIANVDLDDGANTIRVCVTDAVANTGSGAAPGIITQAIPPAVPVAGDRSLSVPQDSSASLLLLASDRDGDTLTFAIDSGPTHGGVTLGGTLCEVLAGTSYCSREIVYTPDGGYAGADAFTFEVSDGTDQVTGEVAIDILALGTAGGGSVSLIATPPGAALSTGEDPRADDPVTTTVTTSESGATGNVSISEGSAGDVDGFDIFGQEVDITAPAGMIGDPIQIVFRVDLSMLPGGFDVSDLIVLKDGGSVPACNTAGVLDPAPTCVSSVTLGAFLEVVVLSTTASVWNLAITFVPPPGGGGGGGTPVPAVPVLIRSSPGSPANENLPSIIGEADADATVSLYTSTDCTGLVAASDSGLQFALNGIQVAVPDNSSTVFTAKASNGGAESECSESSLTYVEDSRAPAVTIESGPATPAFAQDVSFLFSADESGVAFECSLSRNQEPANESACSSPVDLTGLVEGTYVFEVTGRDAAGNRGSDSYDFVIDPGNLLLSANASARRISPNGDGKFDEVHINGQFRRSVSWTLRIVKVTEEGFESQRTRRGEGNAFSLRWRGRHLGSYVADGVYMWRLVARDAQGNEVTPYLRPIRVDRTAPLVTGLRATKVFRPSAGQKAKVSFTVNERAHARVRFVRDRTGTAIVALRFTLSTDGRVNVKWDGRNRKGGLAAPGRYRVVVIVRDKVANRTILGGLRIDVLGERSASEEAHSLVGDEL